MAKRKAGMGDWLPLAGVRAARVAPTGEAFRPEWIDFERGIRVGNLEPHERITQILKYHLETAHVTPFITDRWGRGVFWQWICWLPRANREAKPRSHDVNFGCAKFFISADTTAKVFKSGLQIERGYAAGTPPFAGCLLQDDWDWNRLMRQCRSGSALDAELGRLLKGEGFVAEVGNWDANAVFDADHFASARDVRTAARRCSAREWAGFQLYYPMPAADVQACTGDELVTAVKGVFAQVTPAMNLCMQITLPGGAPQGAHRQAAIPDAHPRGPR